MNYRYSRKQIADVIRKREAMDSYCVIDDLLATKTEKKPELKEIDLLKIVYSVKTDKLRITDIHLLRWAKQITERVNLLTKLIKK